MRQLKRLLMLTLVVAILIPLDVGHAQEEDAEVARLMADMSTAAKVGQLFLVVFPGAEAGDGTLIAELIRDYHVGGVVLLPANGNIVNEGNTPLQVAALVSQLQEVAWQSTRPTTATATLSDPYIPLFVAVRHEGNGSPFTAIAQGTTPLPSQMALGATWSPEHAGVTGQIAGQELSAMGINMLLGPSLDVVETPRPESAGDLGVRTFGGEPFWVGMMGKAYISGVHEGSNGQVAVIVKHFPGLGSSDRSPDEEVPTVQRTLERLKQVDLAPFAAAAQAEDPLAHPDGMLVSHIRFRGLEGDRFATTRPISVDSQWLQRMLGLPELSSWRESGGVMVSDELGVRALRRFYDPSELSFNGRRIAREAFLAGNDLLILSQFALSGSWEEQGANIKSTISFFQERYENDATFQTRVDEALRRILRLKLALYRGNFRLSTTQPDTDEVGNLVGQSREKLAPVNRAAITLLSPPSPDLLPPPPTADDNIVIFTDSRSGQPCAQCAPTPYIDPLTLQDTIVRLYGPRTTGQVSSWRITSFTFDQLSTHLGAQSLVPPQPTSEAEETTPTAPPDPVGPALQNADWIIFAMLNPADGSPQPGVVRRFLAERADALQRPHLVVLAYDAPYYLDATEISKLSAYYVTYGRTEPVIETSARALFGEFAPAGMPPVSVPGINYDLAVRTSPNPAQTIALHYEIIQEPEEQQTPEPTAEGQPTPEPKLQTGVALRLYTGVIIDHNGHPVPDGTPVQFIFTYPLEAHESSALATTRGGVAETVLTLNRTGQLDISIQADPAPRTVALQVTIQEGGPIILTPTPRATAPPTATPTREPRPTPVETPQPTPGAGNGGEMTELTDKVGVLDLLLALASVLIVGGTGYYLMRTNGKSASQALRLALWCAIGGLGLYLVYALPVPGADWLREKSGVWAAGGVGLLGGMIPLIAAWIAARRKQGEETKLQEG